MKFHEKGVRILIVFILMNTFLPNRIWAADKTKIWLFDFETSAADSTLSSLKQQIPTLLADELSRFNQFQIARVDSTARPVNKLVFDHQKNGWKNLVRIHFNQSETALAVAVLGKWFVTGKFIRLSTKLVALESGSLIAEYSRNVGREDYLPNLKLELRSLAEKLNADLIDKKTPFGYPFHPKEVGILLGDFYADLNNALADSLRLEMWQTVQDSINALSAREKRFHLKLKRLPRELLQIYLLSAHHSDGHQMALQIGRELNATVVLWGHLSATDQNEGVSLQGHLVNTDTSFQVPKIQLAQLAPFAAARQAARVDFPAVAWSEKSLLIDFLTGSLLVREQKYSPALVKIQNLIQALHQFEPPRTEKFLYFYTGNCYFLNGQQQKNDWPQALAAWEKASGDYQKALPMKLADASSARLKALVLNNLGILNQLRGQADSAVAQLNQALQLAQAYHFNNELLRTSHNLANVYLMKRQWKEALNLYLTSAQLLEASSKKNDLAIVLDNCGILYQRLNKSNDAIIHFQRSLELKQALNQPAELAQSYAYLGSVHQEKGDLDAALDFYLKSLDLNLKQKNELQIARIYEQIGMVHRQQGNLNMALEYFLKRAQIMSYLGNDPQLIETNLVIADIYQKKNDYPAALEFLSKARDTAAMIQDQKMQAQIFDKMGEVYNAQQVYDQALLAFEQAAEILKATEQLERLALVLFNMGLVHLKRQEYQSGYDLIKEAVEIDETGGFFNLKKERQFLQELNYLIDELNH